MSFTPNVRKGQAKKEPRILIIGVEGVGKSTAGANLPDPLFVCAEDGLVGPQFANVQSVSPASWTELLQTMEWLAKGGHQFKSVVVDTLDWLEPMLFAHVVESARKPDVKHVEDFGYGKGYQLASSEFRQLLSRLEACNAAGLVVCFLAHSQIKSFSNPVGENYDRFEPKVSKQVSGLVKEWCDLVLFAHFDVYTSKEGGKAKGAGGQVRVVETTHSAAWDAKNRYGLPATMVLDMPAILEAVRGVQPSGTEAMDAEIRRLAEAMPEPKKSKTLEWLAKPGRSEHQTAQVLNKARAESAKEAA